MPLRKSAAMLAFDSLGMAGATSCACPSAKKFPCQTVCSVVHHSYARW